MKIHELTISGQTERDYPEALRKQGSEKLVTQYVQYIQAQTTTGHGHTKTRGEIAGGGAKPWRQKGTGRARIGSIRAPHWRGGGVVFGPRTEEQAVPRMNKKMRRLALLTLLTDAAANDRLFIGNFKAEDEAKAVRTAVSGATGLATRRVLVVEEANTPLRAVRNLKNTEAINLDHFGAKQLLGRSAVIFQESVWEALTKRYSS